MVVGNHVGISVLWFVDLQVGVLPCELLARVNGLWSRERVCSYNGILLYNMAWCEHLTTDHCEDWIQLWQLPVACLWKINIRKLSEMRLSLQSNWKWNALLESQKSVLETEGRTWPWTSLYVYQALGRQFEWKLASRSVFLHISTLMTHGWKYPFFVLMSCITLILQWCRKVVKYCFILSPPACLACMNTVSPQGQDSV